jgi:hypothetical protein
MALDTTLAPAWLNPILDAPDDMVSKRCANVDQQRIYS